MLEKSQLPSEADWAGRIEPMFSGIAPWYDFLNRGLSLGRDIFWRRALVAGLNLAPAPVVLDLAAGTLDVSLELARQRPQARITAVDFSLPMLFKGTEKLGAAGPARIFPAAADALALPFLDNTFDALTIAFGVRNLPRRPAALTEMHRVLKPGGILAVLEFVPPEHGWLAGLYRLYLNRLLPHVGRLLSQHAYAYAYLAESINNFPKAGDFAAQLQAAGFQRVKYQTLTFGVVGLFYGHKAG